MNNSIKVSYERDEITIAASKEGLLKISEICTKLAALSDTEAKTPAGHYHVADYMSNAEAGSVPLVIARRANS